MIAIQDQSLILPQAFKPFYGVDAINVDGAHGVFADGASLDSVYDASGNGNTFTQANATLRPTFETNEVNGQPAFEFNGAQWMSCASSSANNANGAMTFVIAFRANSVTGTQRLIGKLLTAMFSLSNAEYAMTTWFGAGGNSSVSTTTPVVINTWQFAAFVYKPSWTTDFYKNGVFTQNIANALNTTSTDALYLGTRDGAQHFFNGLIAFAYVYPYQLNAWQLIQLFNYYKFRTAIT